VVEIWVVCSDVVVMNVGCLSSSRSMLIEAEGGMNANHMTNICLVS
jgi:hypothetical protein